MKRIAPFLLALMLLFISASCAPSVPTKTDKSKNFRYKENESISIIETKSKKTIGTIMITGVEILKDEPFNIERPDKNVNGEITYKNIEYNQIVQIFYTYTIDDLRWEIGSRNFQIWDSNSNFTDPSMTSLLDEIEYQEIQKEGSLSFVFPLKDKSDYIDVVFYYDTKEKYGSNPNPTAIIRINM